MSGYHSSKREQCADYLKRHKRIVYSTSRHQLYLVGDRADKIRNFVEPDVIINPSDNICRNCLIKFQLETERDDVGDYDDVGDLDESPDVNVEEMLNNTLVKHLSNISPFKPLREVRSDRRANYVKRKKLEIEASVNSFVSTVENTYVKNKNDPLEGTSSSTSCLDCKAWFLNLKTAVDKVSDAHEKIRLLSLIPRSFTKSDVKDNLNCSTYLVDKSRQLVYEKGVYSSSDPYTGHPISQNIIDIALSYFLEDFRGCSRQSPNKADVTTVREGGEKIKKVKRFLTRSIKECYLLFKTENPDLKIGLSKFYSLRPKWVKCQPVREVCACIYCTNLKLITTALRNLTEGTCDENSIFLLTLCDNPEDKCWLDECDKCPKQNGITLERLAIDEDEEEDITYALWEKGDLIKKTVPISSFIDDATEWILKAVTHTFIKKIQREAIYNAKSSVKTSNSIVFHFDFAENWAVILPNEVQSFHWKNPQVSLFTCVAYFENQVKSFAVLSDDLSHDSAHALCALQKIKETVKCFMTELNIKNIIHISDGAASHFKNKYQLFQLKTSASLDIKQEWIFSATGHGKSACDGIGGICKHFATIHNLQKEATDSVRDAYSFVENITPYVKNIQLLLLRNEEIEEFRQAKIIEWAEVKSVLGIRSHHLWIEEDGDIYISRTSRHPPVKVTKF